MNVIERLRAADPVPDPDPVNEAELAAVVTAARTTETKGRTAPRRPVSRRLLLGGVAATAVGATIALAPGLGRQDSAYAATLRKLAHDVAAAPPPDADVLYAKSRSTTISTMSLEPIPEATVDQVVRTRGTSIVEEWHPLRPLAYRPVYTQRTTREYLTPGDAERAESLTPKQRRINGLPPEGRSDSDGGSALEKPTGPPSFDEPTAGFVQDLPSDPAALRARIEREPVFDRFQDILWSPTGIWDRLVNWEETTDDWLGTYVIGLLKFVPTPQPVRSAAIELLAQVRSVVVYGDRTVNGRTGLAIGRTYAPEADALVIDRKTGLVIHEQISLTKQELAHWPEMADQPVGTVHNSWTMLELAYVPDVRVTP